MQKDNFRLFYELTEIYKKIIKTKEETYGQRLFQIFGVFQIDLNWNGQFLINEIFIEKLT